ncbi:FecCD family ABC transporter permease [Allokutzneria sp. NRRL B-24872]|uniref:FecCD family ABC transporter permease n=1 Tax=Allokutzneria sp. NRRL B-24872 TaxID=1137961 RepID=UPI00352D415F
MTVLVGVARKRPPLLFTVLALTAAVVVVCVLAVSFGSVWLPLSHVWGILAEPFAPWLVDVTWSPVRASIVWDSRLPRVAMAVVVGAALAIAGAIAQIVTRNPLADPYLLGVSQGAGLTASLVMVLGVEVLGMVALPPVAFVGALGVLLAVLAISGRSGSVSVLVLAGLAVGQVCSAGLSLVIFLHAKGDQAKQVLFWLAGGLGDARWDALAVPAVVLVLAVLGGIVAGRRINLLHAEDDAATALGVNPRRFRLVMLIGVSLLAGTSVAVAGGIGFVGLIVPHVATFLVGSDARRLLPVSALLGAGFLVAADLLGRLLASPSELPVGVITSAVGGPLFILMLLRNRRRMG